MQTKHLIYMAYLLKPTNHTWKTISQKRLLKMKYEQSQRSWLQKRFKVDKKAEIMSDSH